MDQSVLIIMHDLGARTGYSPSGQCSAVLCGRASRSSCSSVLTPQWTTVADPIHHRQAARGGLDRLRVSHNSLADLFSRSIMAYYSDPTLRTKKPSPVCLYVCYVQRACVKIAGRLCSEIYTVEIYGVPFEV